MQTSLIQESSSTVYDLIGDKILIKGFASTSTVDREKEIVADPKEFDVLTFKQSPVLLADHKWINDKQGNQVAAGKVTKAIPAYIEKEDPSNPENWVVSSLTTDGFVSLWPKEKSVDLKIGSKGLFITAEVTQEDAKRWVAAGELSTLSWRGFAIHEKDPNSSVTTIKGIDLLEISMTRIQANRPSSFTVVDENDPTHRLDIDFTDCKIQSLKFDKDSYDIDKIQAYTKSFNLQTHTISENDESYFLNLGNSSVDATKTFSFCTEKGMTILAAPRKEEEVMPLVGEIETTLITEKHMSQDPKNLLAVDLAEFEKLEGVSIKKLSDIEVNGESYVLHSAVVTEKSAALLEDPEAVVEEVAEPVAEEVAETVVEEVVAEVVAEVAETVVEEVKVEDLTETFQEKVLSILGGVAEKISALDKRQEQTEQLVAQKALETKSYVENTLKSYASKETTAQKLSDIENMFSSLAGSTPEKTPRQEKQESEKSLSQGEEKAVAVFAEYF